MSAFGKGFVTGFSDIRYFIPRKPDAQGLQEMGHCAGIVVAGIAFALIVLGLSELLVNVGSWLSSFGGIGR